MAAENETENKIENEVENEVDIEEVLNSALKRPQRSAEARKLLRDLEIEFGARALAQYTTFRNEFQNAQILRS